MRLGDVTSHALVPLCSALVLVSCMLLVRARRRKVISTGDRQRPRYRAATPLGRHFLSESDILDRSTAGSSVVPHAQMYRRGFGSKSDDARVLQRPGIQPLSPRGATLAHWQLAERFGTSRYKGGKQKQQELEEQLATFSRLRDAARISYDWETHELLLRALWRSCFGPGNASTFKPRSERWRELGFQGPDPTTDFRGAGVMGLRHLLTVVNSGRAPSTATGFPLAVASINATGMLQVAPHLQPLALANVPRRLESNTRTGPQAYFGLNPHVASPLCRAHRRRCSEAMLRNLLTRGGLAPLQARRRRRGKE